MRRNSNAAWQRGFAATPTQFWSYQSRLMDAFMGPRFSKTDKIRALAIYSAVYGIPISTISLGPAGLYPWNDFVKDELRSRGIDPNEGAVGLAVNGMVQTAGKVMFGRDYAFQERMSPSGLPIIREIISGERGWEAIFGASGSISKDIWKDAAPFWHAVSNMVSSQEEFPLAWEDFRAVLANVSTMSNVLKLSAAYNTQMYVTGNGIKVGPVDTIDGFVMAVFGTNPQEYNDVFVMSEALSNHAENKKEFGRLAVKEIQRWIEALNDGNLKTADNYMKRAAVYRILGGWEPHEFGTLIRQAEQATRTPMGIGVERNYNEIIKGLPFGIDPEQENK